jgi:hypothetical protein
MVIEKVIVAVKMEISNNNYRVDNNCNSKINNCNKQIRFRVIVILLHRFNYFNSSNNRKNNRMKIQKN